MRRSILAACLLATAQPSHAAQIAVAQIPASNDKPGLPAIGIYGSIEAADVDRFKELASTLNNAVVFLRSGGGKMAPAIQIGEIIKAKGYTTIVREVCASACALIWLAGSHRFMTATARIGLHQAYTVAGQADGLGNAILGSYLTRLGLSYSAVAYATQASPGEVKWLTVDDAKRVGIALIVVDPNAQPKPPTP
jgi:hypothetical protein